MLTLATIHSVVFNAFVEMTIGAQRQWIVYKLPASNHQGSAPILFNKFPRQIQDVKNEMSLIPGRSWIRYYRL